MSAPSPLVNGEDRPRSIGGVLRGLQSCWLPVGWITIFFVGTDLFIVSPFLPAIGHDFGRMPADMTLMVSLFSITYALVSPVQGRLAERVGLPRVLMFGIVVLGIANLATAFAQDLVSLYASRIVAGLGAASTSPILYALAAERTGPAKRAGNLALINSGLIIALTLGSPLGLMLGSVSGWRTVFGLLGATFLLLFTVNWATWTGSGTARRSTVAHASAESLRGAAQLFLAMICWGASVYATYTILPIAVLRDYGVSVPELAVVLAAFGSGATLGSVFGGRLADRLGAERMVRLCLGLMVVVEAGLIALYGACGTGPVALVVLSVALFGLSLSAYGFFPALQASAARRFTLRRPTVLGLLSSSFYVGMTLGSALGGVGFEQGGMRLVLAISLAFAVLGLSLAVVAIPSWRPAA